MITLDEKSLNSTWEELQTGDKVYKVSKRGSIYPAHITEVEGKLGTDNGGSYRKTTKHLKVNGKQVYNNKVKLSGKLKEPLECHDPDFFPNYDLARKEAIKRVHQMIQTKRQEIQTLYEEERALLERLEFLSTAVK